MCAQKYYKEEKTECKKNLYAGQRMLHGMCIHPIKYKLLPHICGHSLALPSPPLFLDTQLVPGKGLLPVCQIPSLSPSASVSPSSTLCCCVFPALGLLCAGLGGLVWNVVRRGGQAGWSKRGCSIVPTQSIHPPLICRSLGHLGWYGPKQRMQSDGITDAQSIHTRSHCY